MATALVRAPGPRLPEGIVTHLERQPVDVNEARRQWAGYVEALAAASWDTVELEAADNCPDAVFVEDTLVVHGRLAVVTRPGADARRAELGTAEAAARGLGLEIARIEPPGLLDGGDVVDAGGTIYVGTGGRTNAEGAAQLRALLDVPVVEVPVDGVLHLKTVVTALPDGTVVGYPPLAPSPSLFEAFVPAPEPSGAQVVALDERRVLLADDCPRSAELISSLDFEPVVVEIGEFQKLEGAVSCLSVLVSS
jgi:dimethylargininase